MTEQAERDAHLRAPLRAFGRGPDRPVPARNRTVPKVGVAGLGLVEGEMRELAVRKLEEDLDRIAAPWTLRRSADMPLRVLAKPEHEQERIAVGLGGHRHR